MITRFVNRDGTSVETIVKKRRVLAGFFRYAVTRCRLKSSPMPSFERKHGATAFTPYIFSDAELKRLLAAVPAASGPCSEIDADTLRTFVLLLYGAGLRRGEARRLNIGDVDLPRSLLQIRDTKFFKTRIVPVGARLSAVLKAFVAKHHTCPSRDGGDVLFCKRDGMPLTDWRSALRSVAYVRLQASRGTAGLAISLACMISGIRQPSIELRPGIA